MIDLLLLKMYLTGYLNEEEIFALDFSVVNRRRVTEIIKLDICQVEQIFYELESKFEQEENNLEGDIENE